MKNLKQVLYSSIIFYSIIAHPSFSYSQEKNMGKIKNPFFERLQEANRKVTGNIFKQERKKGINEMVNSPFLDNTLKKYTEFKKLDDYERTQEFLKKTTEIFLEYGIGVPFGGKIIEKVDELEKKTGLYDQNKKVFKKVKLL